VQNLVYRNALLVTALLNCRTYAGDARAIESIVAKALKANKVKTGAKEETG